MTNWVAAQIELRPLPNPGRFQLFIERVQHFLANGSNRLGSLFLFCGGIGDKSVVWVFGVEIGGAFH